MDANDWLIKVKNNPQADDNSVVCSTKLHFNVIQPFG